MGPVSRVVAATLLASVMHAGPDTDPLIVRDGVTPRVRAISESGAAEARPTSEPWIDSNLWLVRSRRARAGNRPVWLGHELENPSGGDYARAIDNHIYLETSTYMKPADEWMRTGIWDHEGRLLASAGAEGTLALAEVDLDRPAEWRWLGNFRQQIPRARPVWRVEER